MPDRTNRRDITRRQTPQDRPNIADLIGAAAGGAGGGGCCGGCLPAASVDECTLCGDGAAQRLTFTQPHVDELWDRAQVTLAHDVDCCWESDDLERDCGAYDPDKFFWRLCLAVDCCEIVRGTLTYAKRSGSGCADVVVVYRSVFPWRCGCGNSVYIDERATSGLTAEQLAALPCSLCLQVETDTVTDDCLTDACAGESAPRFLLLDLPDITTTAACLPPGQPCPQFSGAHVLEWGVGFNCGPSPPCCWGKDVGGGACGQQDPGGGGVNYIQAGVIGNPAGAQFSLQFATATSGPQTVFYAQYALNQSGGPIDCLAPMMLDRLPGPFSGGTWCSGWPATIRLTPVA